MPSFLEFLRGAFRRSDRKATKPKHAINFERLEQRNLLAVTSAVTIAGSVDHASSAEGIPGVEIQLLLDDGDDSLNSGDMLVDTTSTDTNGDYRFLEVTPGTYFVRQLAIGGLVQHSGEDVNRIVVDPADLHTVRGAAIDSFDTLQTADASVAMPIVFSSTDASETIGGERDMFTTLTSELGQADVNVDPQLGVLRFNSGPLTQAIHTVTWDGMDVSQQLNSTGLGGYDLTGGGEHTGLAVEVSADDLPAELTLKVYSDGQNWSQATIELPGGIRQVREFAVLFDQFANGGGNGADFANVGAVEMLVDSAAPGTDLQMNWLGLIGPNTLRSDFTNFAPVSVGNRVWLDANNDGHFEAATENGIAGVSLNLYEDSDSSGTYTPGTDGYVASQLTDPEGLYQFHGLRAGDYVVQVDPANFLPGGALEGLASSTGNDPVVDPDSDVDHDDNGASLIGYGVLAQAVSLAAGNEPLADGDSDSSNATVDFGFTHFDLSIEKTDDVDPVVAGEQLTYSLFVMNHGPATAADVIVTDPLPDALVGEEVTASRGSAQMDGSLVTANLGDLLPGETATIDIVTTVASDSSGTIHNVATVTGKRVGSPAVTPDINPLNDQDDEPTRLSSVFDLELVKTQSADPVVAGDELTYTIDVTNHGPSDAAAVTVVDVLPAEVEFVSVQASQGSGVFDNEIVTVGLGDLASGDSATIQLQVNVRPDVVEPFENFAVVRGDPLSTSGGPIIRTETNLDNNEDSVETHVTALRSSISGFVYVDANDNGLREVDELPVVGVPVMLSGVDGLGNDVQLATLTDADGAYRFDQLMPGTYQVIETQPPSLLDGKDTPGVLPGSINPVPVSVFDDTFSNIALQGGVDGVEFNFGELSTDLLTKRDLLGSS